MALDDGQTQTDRFTHALEVVVDVFRSRRRPGNTYQGYVKVLRKNTPLIHRYLAPHLRSEHHRVAGPFQRRLGFQAFAADGSRVEVPRTAANEAALGCAGRKKTGPQLGVTVMYHMGTGLPWDWRIGPGTFSERDHLREMVSTLPEDALVVCDAGFTGYELLTELDAGGTMFLLRVAAKTDPLALSVASALRMVRHAMRTHRYRRQRGDLRASLASALKDGYERRGSKDARDWPHKKNEPPPGEPKTRTATEHEKALAQRVCRAA